MVISIIVAVLLAVFSILKKALTIPGGILAGVIIIVIGFCGSYKDVLFLAISYLVLVAIDMVANKFSEEKIKDVHKKTGSRTIIQVLANGGIATIAIILYKIFSNVAFLLAYEICVIESCADSIASDVGVLSKREPISIITFKKVATGMSGGVSLLGLFSSLIGTVIMAILAACSSGLTEKKLLLLVLVPYFGMMLDSLLGATIQVKYKCPKCGKNTERTSHCDTATVYQSGISFIDNSAVNLITNLLTGIIGYFIAKAVL